MYDMIYDPDNTISKALNIIDPEGIFVPGTSEYKWLEGSLLSWMDTMKPAEVLRKSEAARRMLRQIARTIP